jgi:endonuclease/exonuclease/phosphatase family metal-dependent hydrolase
MTISVLQWNIWYKEDIRNVAEFLRQNRTDIICLQELTIGFSEAINDTPAFIAEQLGYHYYCKKVPIESTDGRQLMFVNGVFSRFPIKSNRFVLTNEPKQGGGYDDEYRVYVEVTLDVGGRYITVGTTHMSYTHRFENTDSKNRETDKLIMEIKKHDKSYIFTGDLNATPNSYTLSSVNNILQNAGPYYDQKTWATKPFSYQGFEESELNWRLDYIFATKDLKVESAEILRTEYSDHLPILAKLKVT